MIKLVIFDLDGTLIDDEIFTITSKVIEGKKLGYNISEEVARNTLGLSYTNSKNYLCSLYGNDFPYDFFRQKRFEYIINDIEKNGIKLKKGVPEIISFLKAQNIKMGICTSSSLKYINEYEKYTGIFKDFDFIITGEQVVKGKPDPEIFLKGIEISNVSPSETLVIEDSNNGILAGIKAKCDVIMIPDLVEPNDEVKKNKVKIFNSLLDVIKYIKIENKGANYDNN